MDRRYLLVVFLVLGLWCFTCAADTLGDTCSVRDEAVQCNRMYVCTESVCSKCTSDADCDRMQPEYVCMSGTCKHKSLLPTVSWRDILGSITIFFASVLSASAGVGGGGIYVPLLILIMSFSAHGAIPISKATAFGTAFATFLMNMRKSHPLVKTRPVIDYDAVFILEPTILMGASVGVILNAVAPSWMILILLFVLLSWVTKKTVTKGVETWKKESIMHKKGAALAQEEKASLVKSQDRQQQSSTHSSSSFGMQGSQDGSNPKSINDGDNAMLAKYNARAMRRFPLDRILPVVGIWVAIIILALIRGGHGGGSVAGVAKCSAAFWGIFAVTFPVCIAVTAYAAFTLRREHREKVACGFQFAAGDVAWTTRSILVYPALCAIGGMMTSLLGLGGAMFVNPLLFELGMNAVVVSATGAFTVLLTASSTSTQFTLAGAMQLDYGGWLWFIGFISALFGQLVIGRIIKKYQRVSPIIFIVGAILVMSCVMMSVSGIMETVARAQAGASLGFLDYCASS